MKNVVLLSVLLFNSLLPFAQSRPDTITIDATIINAAALTPGTARHLVYLKNGRDSTRVNYQLWTRHVEYVKHNNREAIRINQQWEDSDTVFHTVSSVCDRQSFLPLLQDGWWKSFGNMSFDFVTQKASVQGIPLSASDTALLQKRIHTAYMQVVNTYFLNWHLDLEVFSMLPFRVATSYRINFYDPGALPPQQQVYTVIGSGTVKGYNNQEVECWLLRHGEGKNTETFRISKRTKEVSKLEQELNGRYRYKIRLKDSL